jgi:KaiC
MIYPFLIKKLLLEDHYDAVIRHHKHLYWAAITKANEFYVGGANSSSALEAILAYADKYKKCPQGILALTSFVAAEGTAYGIIGKSSAGLEAELLEVEQFPLEQVTPDIDQLILEVVTQVRDEFHIQAYNVARGIASGNAIAEWKNKVKREWVGRKDAREWFNARMLHDLEDEIPQAAGLLHEQSAVWMEYIRRNFRDTAAERRCDTGFAHIDNAVTIGFDHLRFVGIAGESSHGKSLMLNTLVYNWLRKGKNILYISMEHKPENIWAKLAFLHGDYFAKRFKLPAFRDWLLGNKSPNAIVQQDWDNLEILRADIQERGGLKGKLDLQNALRTWPEIVSHLETNFANIPYDILVVDYLESLDMPGDARNRDSEFKALIKAACALSQTFAEGRGLVVVTPMPINKEGAKAAAAYDPANDNKPFSLQAVRGASEFGYTLDLGIGVYSSDDLKDQNSMQVFAIKVREGRSIHTKTFKVNPDNQMLKEQFADTDALEEFQTKAMNAFVEEVVYEEQEITTQDV